MLKYDTVHGRFDGEVSHKDDAIIVNGNEIKVFDKMNPVGNSVGRNRCGITL